MPPGWNQTRFLHVQSTQAENYATKMGPQIDTRTCSWAKRWQICVYLAHYVTSTESSFGKGPMFINMEVYTQSQLNS